MRLLSGPKSALYNNIANISITEPGFWVCERRENHRLAIRPPVRKRGPDGCPLVLPKRRFRLGTNHVQFYLTPGLAKPLIFSRERCGAAMGGRASDRDQAEERSLDLDALLSLARSLAAGEPAWSSPQLRPAFAARLGAGEDPLGDRYSAIVSAGRRRSTGAVLTPRRIVQAMLDWSKNEATVSGEPRRIVDAGAGTGRFAMAAARAFPKSAVVAVENDRNLLVLLRANLREAGLDGRVSVVDADFRSIGLDKVPGPTLFLGNPPYVRHHQIPPEWKRWYVDACARHGVKASQLAGAHLHFFAKIADLGETGDYGCLITAAEWLDVGYGAALRSLLANGIGGVEVHLLEPAAEAFPGTMTTAAITAFRIGRRPSALRLRSVASPAGLDRLEGGREVAWPTLADAAKWSVFVRPAPKAPSGMIELGELCRVHRGQVTGNNGVWIAKPETPDLPPRFLFQAITRARELFELSDRGLERLDHLRCVIDLPVKVDSLAADERRAVQKFLAWAKSRRADQSYVAVHRRAWWSVGLREPAPILCTYMARRAPAFVRNTAGARHLNIAHGLYPREPMTEDELASILEYLNKTADVANGRAYAGGLVKFEPGEIERLRIPGQLLQASRPVSLGRVANGASRPVRREVTRS